MRFFRWISARPLPAVHDLRRRGWGLRSGLPREPEPDCAMLVDGARTAAIGEIGLTLRRNSLVLEVADSAARLRWLEAGFADALPCATGIDELALRAARLLAAAAPAVIRAHGRLVLDLVARDARVDGRRLRLNPREFALLWRLAEAGGELVARPALLQDVWNLAFDPGTNSLAVHICRLRKKLDAAGLGTLLETGPGDAGYRLFATEASPRIALDAPRRLREPERMLEEIAP